MLGNVQYTCGIHGVNHEMLSSLVENRDLGIGEEEICGGLIHCT